MKTLALLHPFYKRLKFRICELYLKINGVKCFQDINLYAESYTLSPLVANQYIFSNRLDRRIFVEMGGAGSIDCVAVRDLVRNEVGSTPKKLCGEVIAIYLSDSISANVAIVDSVSRMVGYDARSKLVVKFHPRTGFWLRILTKKLCKQKLPFFVYYHHLPHKFKQDFKNAKWVLAGFSSVNSDAVERGSILYLCRKAARVDLNEFQLNFYANCLHEFGEVRELG